MMEKGQIFKIHSDFYYVLQDNVQIELKAREVLKKQNKRILVGDFVEFDNGFIEKIMPRKNYLPRPNVANVEQIVVVSSIKEPDLDFQQLDRYFSLAKYYKIDTKLCFNKDDLSLDDSVIEKVFQIYEPLNYDIVFTSALEKDGIEDLEEILKGKTTVFCGNSGVGKSSLINAISPELNIKTKKVSEKTERGTHTTRHCEIITLDDFRIVDTPGFSNVKFDFLLPTEVDYLFDEIKKYKGLCKYSDCIHIQENGCEVLAHIDEINLSRYASYKIFVEEAKEYKEKIKYEGKKTETAHKTVNDKTMTKISSRKRESARNTQKQGIKKEMKK